jgi:hypothetical protein
MAGAANAGNIAGPVTACMDPALAKEAPVMPEPIRSIGGPPPHGLPEARLG